MYKILLAEDEPEVLDAILETIDWQAFCFCRPRGCRNGREAIAALEGGFSPDVVITDICMPFVDGLELTRYLTEKLPDTVVVILSGYDEFSYAQQAVQLKVYDYILKPVAPSVLGGLLRRLRQELEQRERNNPRDFLPILQSHFLNQLLTSRMDGETVEGKLARYEIALAGKSQVVAVVDFDHAGDLDGGGDLELLRYGLQNIARELAEPVDGLLVFQGQDGATKLIVCGTGKKACHELAVSFSRTLCGTVAQNLKRTVSVGVGEAVDAPTRLHVSHTEAQEALEYRFFYGESSVLLWSDIQRHQDAAVDVAPVYEVFDEALKALDIQAAKQAVEGLMDSLRRSHVPLAKCAGCCQRIVASLLAFISRSAGEEDRKCVETMWEEADFFSAGTIGQLEEMILTLCDKALKLLEPPSSGSPGTLVRAAESYIRERYASPGLSLQAVTDHLSISVSYFSAIFKAHTGSTFVEYLTRMRMDKAKQLLTRTDMRTYETAEAVGYSDPHYFSVAFKRVTGMSPKEYREYSRQNPPAQNP